MYHPPMRSYVEFIRVERGNPQGVSTTVEVKDRDVAKLPIPPSADFFYFYDSPDALTPEQSKNDQRDISRFYIVAEKMVTREEAKRMIAPALNAAAKKQLVWDTKLEQNEFFALTRSGNIEPVRKDSIVIDAKRNQLYPRTDLPPEKPKQKIRMELEGDITAPPRARFRPRNKPAI